MRETDYDLDQRLDRITPENLHESSTSADRSARKPSDMVGLYVSDAGDVIWLHFDPQHGREQRGHSPALVISPASCNGKTGLMVCCPMTSQAKGYPFEVPFAGEARSLVLADQVESLDWKGRKAEFKKKLSPPTLSDMKRKIHALLGRPWPAAGVFDVTTEFFEGEGSARSPKDVDAAVTQATSPIFADFHRITSTSMATAFAMSRHARSAVSTLTPSRCASARQARPPKDRPAVFVNDRSNPAT